MISSLFYYPNSLIHTLYSISIFILLFFTSFSFSFFYRQISHAFSFISFIQFLHSLSFPVSSHFIPFSFILFYRICLSCPLETMFEARFPQGSILKLIVEAMKDLVVDANFECSDTEITVQVQLCYLLMTIGYGFFPCFLNHIGFT